jgi:AraC family transcriptional regulator
VYLDREVFSLTDLWQMHFYLYDGRITVGDFSVTVRRGDVTLWPPGTVVDQTYYGRSKHIYVHFRPGETGIPRLVPMVQHSGKRMASIAELLMSAVGASLSNRSQVAADVWAVLCRVADLSHAHRDVPESIAAAIRHIEANLAESLRVPDIAHQVGLSPNHLTRRFKIATGRTVVAYVRGRRVARARHLLVASTLSVASIAASVGIPDLQAFNKACRAELGASPRAVRRGEGTPSFQASPHEDEETQFVDRPRHFKPGSGEEIFLDAPIAGMESFHRFVTDELGDARRPVGQGGRPGADNIGRSRPA